MVSPGGPPHRDGECGDARRFSGDLGGLEGSRRESSGNPPRNARHPRAGHRPHRLVPLRDAQPLLVERFVSQESHEDRSIEQTLTIAWELLSGLPASELKKIDEKYIKKYLPQQAEKE